MNPSDTLALERLAGIAERLFSDVRDATFDGVGVTRASYGAGEERALALVQAYAQSQGLLAERDACLNLVVRLPDEPPGKVLLIGSHFDSVPQGGNFDGLAGIVAGVLLLIHYRNSGRPPAQPVRVLGLRGEESAWYGKAYICLLYTSPSPRD